MPTSTAASASPRPTGCSLAALNAAREVWFVVAGAEKADAVALAVSGASREDAPAAGVRGREQTLWLLDESAASAVPARPSP